MVVYILYLKADLQNVASIKLLCEGSTLCLSARNPVDATQYREQIVIDSSALEEAATVPLKKAAHAEIPCHFALKWNTHDAERATITVVHGAVAAKKYNTRMITARDNGNYVPVLALDCQGIEPYAFHPMGHEFFVTSTSAQEFRPDLSKGDWSDFDYANGTTSITNVQAKFE
jgi:hypothetical protein